MHRNPRLFVEILEEAALKVETAKEHPGQVFPGVWQVGGENPPERIIGIVAAAALGEVAKERNIDLDLVLAGYVEVARDIRIRPKGGPDVIAAAHLRDAAAKLKQRHILS